MGAHRDAEMAEVVVVLSESCSGRVEQSLDLVRGAGLEVNETDADNLTVVGTIDAAKLPALRSMGCVNYVRVSMTYIADFPVGHPRDADGPEDEDDVVDEDPDKESDPAWSPV